MSLYEDHAALVGRRHAGIANQDRKSRKCLKCGQMFKSVNLGNRVCFKCSTQRVFRSPLSQSCNLVPDPRSPLNPSQES